MPQADDPYPAARAELLRAEIALRDQREAVARMRRALPEGPPVADYVFREARPGGEGDVRLAELFGDRDTLIVIHFMYGRAQKNPCPMCSMWADGYDAVLHHVRRRAAMAAVAAAPAADLAALKRERGWAALRFLSSADNGFNRDFGMEGADGAQLPGISVFTRGADGTVRQHYTGCAVMAEGEYRGLDLLSPVWNLFDLTPEGRGDWMPGGH